MLALIGLLGAVVGIGVVVGFHELGHFLAGLITKTAMDEFAIGMGPKIWGKTFGGMDFNLRILPLGGYVKFTSVTSDVEKNGLILELGGESPRLCLPRERGSYMENKNPWQKLFIILMGPAFSVLLCPLCFALAFMHMGISNISIITVDADSPADKAGIQAGDAVLRINKEKATSASLLGFYIAEAKDGAQIELEMERNGEKIVVELAPFTKDGKRYIGATIEDKRKHAGIRESVNEAFLHSLTLGKAMCHGIRNLFTGKAKSDSYAGPVGIVKMFSSNAKAGIGPYLTFMGALSLNLAIVNMLPIPPFDGGKTVIYGFEAVSTKKLPENAVKYVTAFFTLIILGLFVLTFFLDLKNF